MANKPAARGTRQKNSTPSQPPVAPGWLDEALRVPGFFLDLMARRLATRADELPPDKGARLARAARVLLAVGDALDRDDDEALKELDQAATSALGIRRRSGASVAKFTKTKADSDAELIRFFDLQLKLIREGNLTPEEFCRDVDLVFRTRRIVAKPSVPALIRVFAEVDDTLTASAVARKALRAVGVPEKDLKNFGAGAAKRTRRQSPNKPRKR